MLVDLSIKDFAIIESLTLTLGPGLNAFTGETGAGKSIIMDALDLVLGDRASTELVRTGADEAVVEALFDISNIKRFVTLLEGAGLTPSDTLVIRRTVQRSGRSKVHINGAFATLATLAEIASPLVEICGQSQHQSLTKTEEQLDLLDDYAACGGLRKEMALRFAQWNAAKSTLSALKRDIENATADRELKEFQLKEISDAALSEGEEEELSKERDSLKNFENIVRAAASGEAVLYSDDGSIVEKLGRVVNELKEVSGYDDSLKSVATELERSLYEIEEAASSLRDRSRGDGFDAEILIELEDRLDLIATLKRKYGSTLSSVIEKGLLLGEELKKIESYDEQLTALEGEAEEAGERVRETASKLTAVRTKAATGFKADIEAELKKLGMQGAVLEIDIETVGLEAATEDGADTISFMISPNPGEELKPLAKIASGGELSRIMLAVKRSTSVKRVPTLVFDEVDTGVGADMGTNVGRMIKDVSLANQVLCITHLPQIAAMADTHYNVSKGPDEDGRTVTRVTRLTDDEKVIEISRMLGGAAGAADGIAIEHAKELLAGNI